jgi:hypothetical protein
MASFRGLFLVAEMCTTEPFAVEHIRGGTLGAGQKVLQTYIS